MGKPKEILSDKTLNSIGTDRKFREALDKLEKYKIYNKLSSQKLYRSLMLL